MEKSHPSILLVETWVELARNDKFPTAQHFSVSKLKAIFGSISDAEQYLETEKVQLFNRNDAC